MEATPHLKIIAQTTCGKLFEYYAEFLIAGTYYRSEAVSAPVAFLVAPIPASLLAGADLDPNDEQIFMDATDLKAIANPQPGDYLVEAASGLRRDVITAHQDMAGVMWTMVARRIFKVI